MNPRQIMAAVERNGARLVKTPRGGGLTWQPQVRLPMALVVAITQNRAELLALVEEPDRKPVPMDQILAWLTEKGFALVEVAGRVETRPREPMVTRRLEPYQAELLAHLRAQVGAPAPESLAAPSPAGDGLTDGVQFVWYDYAACKLCGQNAWWWSQTDHTVKRCGVCHPQPRKEQA